MTDDQFFLANAYLDGELSADEIALAEADPAVMAEVETLRELQRSVRDVEPPAASARESAIAAAMAEFTAAATTSAPPVAGPAPVVPFRPRPAYAKYLAVAAAVVAVGVLGVAVANLGVGGDDDSSADSAATVEDTISELSRMDAADDAGGGDDAESFEAEDMAAEATMADEAMADEAMADPSAEMADEGTAEATTPVDAGEETESSGAPTEGGGLEPPIRLGDPITNPDQLASYATLLLEARDDGTLPDPPEHPCVDFGEVLGDAVYLDAFDADAVEVPIVITLLSEDGLEIVYAIRADTTDGDCAVVADALLPER